MDVFDLDSRHPKYERDVQRKSGKGSCMVRIYFIGGHDHIDRNVDFEWEELGDGIHVTASKPDLTGVTMPPDDVKYDVTVCISLLLDREIEKLTWVES